MNVSLEKVTDFLKPFLLQNIIIKTDKKVLKRGKLKIFQIKQYYINFTLEYKDSIKSYEIPYPYKLDWDETTAILDYWNAAEQTNGRLAMIGFFALIHNYALTGWIIPGIF